MLGGTGADYSSIFGTTDGASGIFSGAKWWRQLGREPGVPVVVVEVEIRISDVSNATGTPATDGTVAAVDAVAESTAVVGMEVMVL